MISTQIYTNNVDYMNQPFHSRFNGTSPLDPTQETAPWAQSIPLQMPWSANVPELMRFTAQTSQLSAPLQPQMNGVPFEVHRPPLIAEPKEDLPPISKWKFPPSTNHNTFPIKRRNSSSDEDDEDVEPPTKVHAGADKVAAKLSHLDIDPDNHRVIVEELSDDSQDGLEEDMSENNQPVIHLSDEVKSAFANGQTDSISQMLQEELDKNRKALVIWRPPVNLINPYQEDDDDDLSTGITIEEIFDDDDQMEIS